MSFQRFRRNKNASFSTIDNTVTHDRNLSLKAKGLILTIMGLPDDWDFSVRGIVSIVKEGKAAVYSAIAELREAGYVKRSAKYENGKIVEWVYDFYERPMVIDDELLTDFQELENLEVGNLDIENRTQLKKQLINETLNQETINASDQKIEISTTIASSIDSYDPAGMLFDAFPQFQFHTTHIGFIEAQVTDCDRDREAWRLTVEKYQQNFNLQTKAYIPTKISNVLDTFRAIRDRIPEKKQAPGWQDELNSQAEICKPVYVG